MDELATNDNYTVRWKLAGATEYPSRPWPSTTATTYAIIGLVNGTAYNMSVRANDGSLSSEWSNEATIVPGDAPTTPTANITPTPTETPTVTPTPTITPTITLTPTATLTPTPAGPGSARTPESLGGAMSTPTMTPRPNATPVPIEKVEVTPVPDAVTIQPDERYRVESGGSVLEIPYESQARTYQVIFAETDTYQAKALRSADVWVYTAEGERDYPKWSIQPLEISFILSKREVEDFGGLDALFQGYATGDVTIQVSDRLPGKWNVIRPAFFEASPDGGSTLYAMTRYIGSTFRLYANPASELIAGVGQETEDSGSVVSPKPTITVEPTATAEPRDTGLPGTGGGLSSMTLIFALMAAAIFMSLLVTISIADRLRPSKS